MSKQKLLVVDDELFVRELLDEYFSKLDFEVVVANSGPAALKLVAENSFKVALVDLKMTDMDGLEVLKNLQKLDENLIVILMTGYPTVESSIEAMRSGAYDYAIKPFRLNDLKEMITRALKEYQVRSEISELKSRIAGVERRLERISVKPDSDLKIGGGKKSRRQTSTENSTDPSSNYSVLAIESQIERWGKLLEGGLISHREFEENKKRILSAV
ncbi:MAG: response regulator [candidate division Zixibacteria bacterium]|nr:response regulator [candidate division Zixibacteria bacterium]MBU1472139.1 response regulator [candidate division Zixibacteria bacterium]MBU2625666.1 response regulator [candidate division Zixibacteria bacterium]